MGAYPHGWPVPDYRLPPGVESQYIHNQGTGAIYSQFPPIAPRPHPDQELFLKAQLSSQASQTPPIYPEPALASSIHDITNLQHQAYTQDFANSQAQSHNTSLYGPIDALWAPSGPAHTLPVAQPLIAPSNTQSIHSPPDSSSSMTPTNFTSTPYTYEPRMPESLISSSSYIPVATHSKNPYQTVYINGIHTPRSDFGKSLSCKGVCLLQDMSRLIDVWPC